jgi:hypothetical protein
MYIIAIAWFYVVLMMAVAEATSTQGTLVGAVITFVLYGVLPVSLLMYILGTPGRKRRLKAAEAAEVSKADAATAAQAGSAAPDGSGVATGDAVAAERKEP